MTNPNEVSLLPCPFCGGAASIKYDAGNERFNKTWHVGCKPCGIWFWGEGSNSWASNVKQDLAAVTKAITAWGTRTSATSDEADVSDDRKMLNWLLEDKRSTHIWNNVFHDAERDLGNSVREVIRVATLTPNKQENVWPTPMK